MGVLGNSLFYRSDMVGLSDVLRRQLDELRSAVDGLPDRLFAEKTDAEIVSQVARDRSVSPLVVDFAGAKASVVEAEVEVQDRFGAYGGRSIGVPGLKATKSIPFKGDPQPWRLHAGSRTTNPPRGGFAARPWS